MTPKVGDVVIVHEDDPRFKWKRAIVVKIMPSEDGQIRKCKIKLQGFKRETTRAVSLLHPLELTAETFVDADQLEYANKICEEEEQNNFEGFVHPDHAWRAEALTRMAKELKDIHPFVYSSDEDDEETCEEPEPLSEGESEEEMVVSDSSVSSGSGSEDENIPERSAAVQKSSREQRLLNRNSDK